MSILAPPDSPSRAALHKQLLVQGSDTFHDPEEEEGGIPTKELGVASENIQIPPGGESALSETEQSLQVRLSLQQPGADAFLSAGFAPQEEAGVEADSKIFSSNRNNECADIIVKVMLLSVHFPLHEYKMQSGEVVDGREVCDHFNSLMANMAFNCEAGITKECADIFRNALLLSKLVLEDAVTVPATFVKEGQYGDGDVYKLKLCMVDLLRTLASMGAFGLDSMSEREFSRACRSAESQGASTMCNFMRSDDCMVREAYSSADRLYYNFDKGISNLKKLCEMDDERMVLFLAGAKESVRTFLTSFVMASIFDGNRMRCANAIAARFYGKLDTPDAFGKSVYVQKLFGSTSDLVSISRIVYTIGALLGMARCNLFNAANEAVVARLAQQTASTSTSNAAPLSANDHARVEDHHRMLVQKEVEGMPQWRAVSDMAHRLNNAVHDRLGLKNDSPGANANAMNAIADWFEEGMRDSVKFSVLLSAFAYEGICIDKPDREVRTSWRKFREANGQLEKTNVSLWFASQFLISSRLERHDVSVSGSNIITAALIVMSGCISHLAGVDEAGKMPVRGPFKFSPHVEQTAKNMYKNFGECINKIRVVYDPESSERIDLGKKCRMTDITRLIFNRKRVRRQHEKSKLVDTRLKACLFWMSVKEALDFDISCTHETLPPTKSGVNTSPIEGRRGLRRMYIIALQTLPCLKFASCRNGEVPHLIEHSRDAPSNKKTTGDNTEKPWRDINGGSLISTFFYPIAGGAYISTIGRLIDKYGPTETDLLLEPNDEDDDEVAQEKEDRRLLYEQNFECKTQQAVNQFAECFEQRVKDAFPRDKVVKPTSGLMKQQYGRAEVVLGQQVSMAMSFSKCMRHCAPLWEDMNLIFSVQKDKPLKVTTQEHDDEDDDVHFVMPGPPEAAGLSTAAVDAPKHDDYDDDEDLWEPATVCGQTNAVAEDEEQEYYYEEQEAEHVDKRARTE